VEAVVNGPGRNPEAVFWKDRRVIVTGHTGFKGAWLSLWLRKLGAKVTGIALPPVTTPNLFQLASVHESAKTHFHDIRDAAELANIIRAANPEIVLHLAAQSLVRAGYRDPLGTFAANVMGTAHVLDALRGVASVRAAVIVTTDKVYQNVAHTVPFRENDPLGGHDPYSASKAASEIVVSSYRDSFLAAQGIAVASARAGNVIGGGDWCDNRLIPDAVRAWQSATVLEIRKPDAIRPWQHVLEPLAGYLTLAEKIWERPALAGAYNFGPATREVASVRKVVELARAAYGSGEVRFGVADAGPHEADWLMLDTAKSAGVLGVTPRWNLEESVGRTMGWYRALHAGANARDLCHAEIEAYENFS
jgi:CDP-glucose 4,6-dehydratase